VNSLKKESPSGLRKFGLDFIDAVPWGTHLCQLYKTKQDLLDILVPYFAAGLRGNEFCLWVTAPPLNVEEAKEALKQAVPNWEACVRRKQVEILPFEKIYFSQGGFNAENIPKRWVEKEKVAIKKGFDGLRQASMLSFDDPKLADELWRNLRLRKNGE
jgi:hypothetical protein